MSDASIITRAGLPASLVTNSVEEYVERIVELVDDDEKRIDIARKVAAVDVAKFYQPDESGAFLKAFHDLYQQNIVERAA